MKILLDECTPHIVKKLLPHRAISTVQEMGWRGIKNGALLKLAEPLFDVFMTTDKNLKHQQNLSTNRLAFLQLPSNQVPVVEALIPEIDAALGKIQSGEIVEISLPLP